MLRSAAGAAAVASCRKTLLIAHVLPHAQLLMFTWTPSDTVHVIQMFASYTLGAM
jgi:hypothetical protein